MLNLWNEYEQWLLRRVGYPRLMGGRNPVLPVNARYTQLFDILHNTRFEIIIERDKNRIEDGFSLRYDFFDELDINGGFEEPCGVLEVLVALAIRINDEYIGDPEEPHPEYIFWEFLKNLELTEFDDRHFDEKIVSKTLGIFIGRKYAKDGRGGILPLKWAKTDQREVEIWSQMMAYLSENY